MKRRARARRMSMVRFRIRVFVGFERLFRVVRSVAIINIANKV